MIKTLKTLKNLVTKKVDKMTSEYLFDGTKNKKSILNCNSCVFKQNCKHINHIDQICENVEAIKYDFNKKTILIIDDNDGIVSFIQEDFMFFDESNQLNINDFNIIAVSSNNAGFIFEAIFTKGELNIDYAIIDITLGGTQVMSETSKRYTGVDIFEMIYKKNKHFKFLFYTGNNLNPYIKSNKKAIDQFKNLTGVDIQNFILFKTLLNMDDRRNNIFKKLFES